MSFSNDVREEIARSITDRDRQFACLYGILLYSRIFTQEPQPEQMEKPESKPSVQSSPKTEESKVCGKKFSEYLEERKLKNTEVIRISSETHRKLKQIAMATGLGMHNIANNILEDILTSHNKEIQAILKKYMSI